MAEPSACFHRGNSKNVTGPSTEEAGMFGEGSLASPRGVTGVTVSKSERPQIGGTVDPLRGAMAGTAGHDQPSLCPP